jgi:anti-sigma factor RsiW
MIMDGCDEQTLSAYADGELSGGGRATVEAHLRECAECRGILEQIRESSRMLREYPFDDLRDEELAHAHAAIDDASDRPILRLGFSLGVIAASVLIVSCAWLYELRGDNRPDLPQQVVTRVAPPIAPNAPNAPNAPAPQWERMAMTLRADPLPHPGDDTSRFADAKLADFMLDSLAPREN